MNVVIAALLAAAVLVIWPAAPMHRLRDNATTFTRPRLPFGARARARRTNQRVRALTLLDAFAAELATGAPATSALVAAAGDDPICPSARIAAARGGDVAAALELDAVACHLPVLRAFAACWRVGERSGAGLGDAVEQLLRSARSVEEVNVQLEAQLAAPRATARLLATLPLVGVVMGMMLGANPVAWLLGTGPGMLCLAGGITLTVLGWAWTAQIAARVTRLM